MAKADHDRDLTAGSMGASQGGALASSLWLASRPSLWQSRGFHEHLSVDDFQISIARWLFVFLFDCSCVPRIPFRLPAGHTSPARSEDAVCLELRSSPSPPCLSFCILTSCMGCALFPGPGLQTSASSASGTHCWPLTQPDGSPALPSSFLQCPQRWAPHHDLPSRALSPGTLLRHLQ